MELCVYLRQRGSQLEYLEPSVDHFPGNLEPESQLQRPLINFS